jgi:Flp pilus assembly protein TadG
MSAEVCLLPLSVASRGHERQEAPPRGRGRRRRNESGVTTLTVVLIIPGLLFLVMSVAQFVVYYHASHLATAAAQEGVRAAQAADGSAADAQSHTQDFLAQAGPNLVLGPRVDVTRDVDTARVEVRAQAPQLVPGLRLDLDAVATGPVERFRADPGP